MANSIGNVNQQPYWLKTPDRYMIDQERMHHNEAVYAYGEYSFFILFWGIDDLRDGRVVRCPHCYPSGISTDIASAYNQPVQALCEYCYGTTYWSPTAAHLNGLKARIVRPCQWNTTDETWKWGAGGKSGKVAEVGTQVQSISDFRMRTGDFVFRADKTRWRVQSRKTDIMISGFQAADDINAMIGYNHMDIKAEDPSSVAFVVPPDTDTAAQVLNISTVPNYPMDFSSWEVINGPLIGAAFAGEQTTGPSFIQ